MVQNKGTNDEFFIDPVDGKMTILNIGKNPVAKTQGVQSNELNCKKKLEAFKSQLKRKELKKQREVLNKYARNGAYKAKARHKSTKINVSLGHYREEHVSMRGESIRVQFSEQFNQEKL
jgi:hypothetical protein